MARSIEIYDTTLRDGSQGQGIHFSVDDKLRIAAELERFGMNYIEGGWPGSNPRDVEFFARAKKIKFKHAKLAAFGSTRRKGVRASEDAQVRGLLEVDTPVVTIYGKTSALHVREVLRCSPEENLAMIRDTVAFLKSHRREVVYDCEHAIDGWKEDPAYAIATMLAAVEGGADRIVLCDTNGGSLPATVAAATRAVLAATKVPVGIHTHDDAGLGLANALASLEAGASHVQGTVNGIGERTGNCDLTAVIPCAQLKFGWKCVSSTSLKGLAGLSRFVDGVANLAPDPRRPWVGTAAFAHKGGTHVDAVRKFSAAYEHIDPTVVGNERMVLVSDQSGRSNITMKAKSLGIDLDRDSPATSTALDELKKLEHAGWSFEDAEASLALLLRRHLGKTKTVPFEVMSYHVTARGAQGSAYCEAVVRVSVGGKESLTVAEGDGPVHALDQALRSALVKSLPKIAKVSLVDYKVRILGGADGTAAKTRVVIRSSDGKTSWGTVGVSENLVEASLRAIVDGYAYALA
ncbi:MAG: citramalate synthase [Verrucomicrobiota bacterium]